MHSWIRTFFLFIATIFVCSFLHEATLFVRDAKHDMGGLTTQASVTLAQINSTELTTSKRLDTEQKELQEVTVALKHILQRSDEQLFGRDLNSGIFGQVRTVLLSGNTLLVDSDKTIREAGTSLVGASNDLHETLLALRPSLDALAKDLADPSIPETLKNLDETSANLAADTAQLKIMLQSASATAQDIQRVADKVSSEYVKTKNLAWALFKELLTLAGSGAQIFK